MLDLHLSERFSFWEMSMFLLVFELSLFMHENTFKIDKNTQKMQIYKISVRHFIKIVSFASFIPQLTFFFRKTNKHVSKCLSIHIRRLFVLFNLSKR